MVLNFWKVIRLKDNEVLYCDICKKRLSAEVLGGRAYIYVGTNTVIQVTCGDIKCVLPTFENEEK